MLLGWVPESTSQATGIVKFYGGWREAANRAAASAEDPLVWDPTKEGTQSFLGEWEVGEGQGLHGVGRAECS